MLMDSHIRIRNIQLKSCSRFFHEPHPLLLMISSSISMNSNAFCCFRVEFSHTHCLDCSWLTHLDFINLGQIRVCVSSRSAVVTRLQCWYWNKLELCMTLWNNQIYTVGNNYDRCTISKERNGLYLKGDVCVCNTAAVQIILEKLLCNQNSHYKIMDYFRYKRKPKLVVNKDEGRNKYISLWRSNVLYVQWYVKWYLEQQKNQVLAIVELHLSVAISQSVENSTHN